MGRKEMGRRERGTRGEGRGERERLRMDKGIGRGTKRNIEGERF